MSDAPSLDALARDARRRLAAIDAFGASALPDLATSALDALRDDAPDLARHLVAAVDALRAADERIGGLIHRNAMAHVAHIDALTERDAAVARATAAEAQRDALAGAVREYLDAREAVPENFDADHAGADERARVYALWDALDAAQKRLDALLRGAAVAHVRAGVVRAYLDAEERWREGSGVYLPGEDVAAYVARRDAERVRVSELHKAMVAALAAAEGR